MRAGHGGAPSYGFTLTELLITLAIAGILAVIGAPAMGGLLARTRAANAEASIAGSLRHARSAAILRNVRVLMCPSRDGRHCIPGVEWQDGWLVAQDADHDGQPDEDAPVIAAHPAMPAHTRALTSAGRGTIVFHPDGNAAGSNATFTICHAHVDTGKSVVVANSGRMRIADPDPARLRECLAGLRP